MTSTISTYILAGGRSTRMGTDKGLVELNGIPMIQHVINVVKNVSDQIFIISNSEEYVKFNLQVICDEIHEIGPLGGLITGLRNTTSKWNLFIGCDMPYINVEVISLLIKNKSDCHAIIPRHHDQIEPLCALYHSAALPIFEKQVSFGNYKVHDAISKLNIVEIKVPSFLFQDKNPFQNMNTPSDLLS